MVTRERLITRLNSLAVWVIGIGCAILGLVLVRQGLEYHPGDWVVATVFPLFAALILSRKPGHLIGMLMLLGAYNLTLHRPIISWWRFWSGCEIDRYSIG